MNLLVVGTGAITKSMLAEFARSDALRCSAICSRKEETGRAMAEQFGIPTVYTSYEEALADPAIDIVYIGLPNILHYTYARAALEATSTGLEDPQVRVVFRTEYGDTRYDEFSVLRPLSSIRGSQPEE